MNNESGFTYETGLSFSVDKDNVYTLSGSASWFDQHINDWIIWLPTSKGFYSPVNLKKVHAYGVEVQADYAVAIDAKVVWFYYNKNMDERMYPASMTKVMTVILALELMDDMKKTTVITQK